MVFKQVFSLILPFTVLVVVPYFIEPNWKWAGTIPVSLGLAFGVMGMLLLVWCIILLGRVGRGTLAPWSPTKRLVVVGPYRYVRNPMIVGVLLQLLAESVAFGSCPIAVWLLAFFCVNTIYFKFLEEPDLERRFGEDYRKYCSEVGRWLPRLSPYCNGR